jgi:gliding motility-associated-like protein
MSGLGAGIYSAFSITLNGCQYTSPDLIDLNNPGAPSIDLQADTTVCDAYTLVNIAGTNLSGNESYYTQANASGTPLSPGDVITSTQTIYLYDILGSCSDESSFIVTVNNTPSIDNPGPQQVCESYFLPLSITGTNLSGNENYYTDMQSNGGAIIIDALTTTQTVYIYDTNGSCSDEVSFEVTINDIPSLVSFSGGGTYCQGDVIANIMAEVSGIADYTLDYTLDGVPLSITSSNSTIDIGNTSGVYTLTALSDNFCSATLTETQTITINPLPNSPDLSENQSYCANAQPLNMQASGSTGTYTWYSDEALTQILGDSDSYTPDVIVGSTTYYVTATENGCEGSPEAIVISFEDCNIIIPTAFTPDYNQVNDIWELQNIDNIYPNNVVTVYNRWGNKIYESKQGTYNAMPWNGTHQGNELPVASYYYIIEYNDNSTENTTGIVSIIK